jgi:CBS domain-containing protein
MTNVYDLLLERAHRLHTALPGYSVLQATRLMNEWGIGALVVINQQKIIGIFTERDVLRRVVAMQRAPERTMVGEVMTSDVICCSPRMLIEEAREIMMDQRVRHLPVVNDDGEPVGMLSIGDLNAHEVHEQQRQIGNLHEYLYGRT